MARRKTDFKKAYLCIGLSLKDGFSHVWGSCGDTHTLGKWLELIYPDRSREELEEYFEGDTEAQIVEYIHKYLSLRLKAVGGRS